MQALFKPFFCVMISCLFIINTNIYAQESAKKGKLAGKIVDQTTGEDIIGGTVVVEGSTTGSQTDLDGKYFLQLAPGTYTIIASYISYKSKRIENVEIKEGELTSLNISLLENSQELEEVVVQGDARKESAAGLLLQQKNAVAVSSGISAELIKKMPDRTTADVIKRVSGATIQDGKFAIIRGMQDRYNFGMINGVPLPSSEPDRKAFSLELVPAQVIDNMVIFKTATPDKPGEFAGGLIEITTKEVPDENTRFFTLGIGAHSITTFQQFYRSPQASATDWLGYDNGSRQLPSLEQSMEVGSANRGNPDEPTINDSKKFNHQFRPNGYNALPNMSLQGGFSQRLKFINNDLGIVAMITYNNSNVYVPFEQNVVKGINVLDPGSYARNDSTPGQYYKLDNYRNNVNAGGLLNLTYKVGLSNKFFFKNLITQTSSDNTVFRKGVMQDGAGGFGETVDYAKYNDVGYFYQSSRIFFTQLGGEHVLSEQSKVKLNYVLGLNDFYNETPDAKKTFSRSEGTTLAEASAQPTVFNGINTFGSQNTPGRFFAKLNETTYSGSMDLQIPVAAIRTSIKLGGLAQVRSRDFGGRYFNYATKRTDLSNNIYDTITNGTIGADKYFLAEGTSASDSYTASARLLAGYLMGETKLTPSLRAIYGVRLEHYNQKVYAKKGTLLSPDDTVDININWIDPLPSVNLIYALSEKTNLRLSYSRTLSRPEFREFAPLSFFDFTRNSIFLGNEYLTRARIDNVDLKLEFYPKPGYTFSINPFLKSFEKPIVYVLQPSSGYSQISLANAKSAIVFGSEFEGRIGFTESSSKVLQNLTFFGNLALIYSKVDQSNFKTDVTDRGVPIVSGVDSTIYNTQLQGQSPYVFNIGVNYSTKDEWTFTLAVNTYGRRIALVGSNEAYIVYEDPRWVLDGSISKAFAKKWTAKATFADLFAQDLTLYYDLNKNGYFDKGRDEIFEKYRRGTSISLSLGYSF